MENLINICLSIDENYVEPGSVLITSILMNADKRDAIKFFILSSDITEKSKNRIRLLQRIKNCSISFIDVKRSEFNFPIPKGTHFSDANYYRLRIPTLLNHVHKVLYLDSDIIVRKSLRQLFNIDIERFPLAAVPSSTPYASNHIKRLGISKKNKYINSGVLLINCDYWRENDIEEKMLSFILTRPPEYFQNVDQDIINGFFPGEIKYLDNKWNYEVRADIKIEGENCFPVGGFVLHFISNDKPWYENSKHCKEIANLFKEYQRIVEETISPQDNYDIDFAEIVDLKGFDFSLYAMPNYSWKYTDIVFEEMTALFVKQMAKGIKTFIDVGAHYGFYTVLVGKSNPNVEILAFEPVPENFEILIKNLRLNSIDAKCYKEAISDNTGKMKFQVSTQSSQSGFIANPDEEILKEISVSTRCLDDYIELIPDEPTLIKVDTEGNELKVLKGISKLIEKCSDIRLIVEFNPSCLIANGVEPNFFLNYLSELGFELFIIDDVHLKFKKYKKNINYTNFMGERTYRNVYCIRKEQSLNICCFSHDSGLLGAQRSLMELVTKLVEENGIVCTVVLPSDGPLVEELQSGGIATEILEYGWWCDYFPRSNDEIENSAINSFKNIIQKSTFFEDTDPDLIVSNSITFPWGAVTALYHGKPHIWYVREFGELDHGLNFFYSFSKTLKMIKESSNHIILNSFSVMNKFYLDVSENRRTVAYNLVDSWSQDENKKVDLFQHKESLKIIIIGHIARTKGTQEAVEATIKLINSGYDVELCVLGYAETSLGKELISLVHSQHKEDRIHFPGFQSEIMNYMNASDVVLVCSRNEAFGRVTCEAMLAKKPVIGTNTGGTQELIEENIDGLLYTPGNIDELCGKVLYFINNPEKINDFGERGYDNIQKILGKRPADRIVYTVAKQIKEEENPMSEGLIKFTSFLLKKTIAAYELALQQKEEEETCLHKEIDLLNEKLNQEGCEFSERDQIITALNARVNELNQRVLFYSLSKSWRFTRPFRQIAKIFKRGKNE